MNSETIKKIYALEREVLLIKKLQEIQKILLSSGAYSSHNIEVQNANFERLGVPKWERDIVSRMWDVKSKYSHKLFNDVTLLLDEMEKELPDKKKSTKKTVKDMLKEDMIKDVNNL